MSGSSAATTRMSPAGSNQGSSIRCARSARRRPALLGVVRERRGVDGAATRPRRRPGRNARRARPRRQRPASSTRAGLVGPDAPSDAQLAARTSSPRAVAGEPPSRRERRRAPTAARPARHAVEQRGADTARDGARARRRARPTRLVRRPGGSRRGRAAVTRARCSTASPGPPARGRAAELLGQRARRRRCRRRRLERGRGPRAWSASSSAVRSGRRVTRRFHHAADTTSGRSSRTGDRHRTYHPSGVAGTVPGVRCPRAARTMSAQPGRTMSVPSRGRRRTRLLGGVAVGACAAPARRRRHEPGPRKRPTAPTIDVQLLSFNDFHGNLEPPSRVQRPADPRSHARRQERREPTDVTTDTLDSPRSRRRRVPRDAPRAGAQGPPVTSLTVAAGDLIGASPLLSAAFHDEPTIEALNALGPRRLLRRQPRVRRGLQRAAAHGERAAASTTATARTTRTPAPTHPSRGADFDYLAANVKYAGHRTRRSSRRTRSRTSTAPRSASSA